MHGHINFIVRKCPFKLFCKKPLVPYFGQCDIEDLISHGLNDHYLSSYIRMNLPDFITYLFSLAKCKFAAPGTYSNYSIAHDYLVAGNFRYFSNLNNLLIILRECGDGLPFDTFLRFLISMPMYFWVIRLVYSSMILNF